MMVLALALCLLGTGAVQYIRIACQSSGKQIGQNEHMLGVFCIAGFGAMLVIGVKQHLWLGCVPGGDSSCGRICFRFEKGPG